MNTINRRGFLGLAAAAAVTPVVGAGKSARKGFFLEAEREIPLDDWADVIVAGGGPAGVATAVAAARGGKKVRLLELQGCLGGVWTAGMLTYIFDFDKCDTGFEIMKRLDKLGARKVDKADTYNVQRDWVYEPEYMKFVCEEMCREAGVKGYAAVSCRRRISRCVRKKHRNDRHRIEVRPPCLYRQDLRGLHR